MIHTGYFSVKLCSGDLEAGDADLTSSLSRILTSIQDRFPGAGHRVPILPSRPLQPLQAATGAPKSAWGPPANLSSTRIRARIIAPVTPSLPSTVHRAVHRWF